VEDHDCYSPYDRIEDTIDWAVTISICGNYISYIRNEAELMYNTISKHLIEQVHQTGAMLNVMTLNLKKPSILIVQQWSN